MSNSSSQTLKIHPHFKLVFIVITGFTALSLLIMFVLTILYPESKTMDQLPILVQRLNDSCDFAWKMGLGAIIGLVGGNISSQ